jgi:membrane protein involved in colicin uptake
VTSAQLFQPFNLGLGLGLIFTGLALWRVFRVKMELSRFKRHLSDRIELEAESVRRAKSELEQIKRENEQLRIRVASFNEMPEWRAHRDLEVYVRAEKRMLVNAPGFAAAWENAKAAAQAELQEEDAGRSLHKRVLSRLFGSGSSKEALPPGGNTAES